MKIDGVIKAVYDTTMEHTRKTREHPNLVIYIDHGFYGECYRELVMSQVQLIHVYFDFVNAGTIFGNTVFPVHPNHGNDHPEFSVYVI